MAVRHFDINTFFVETSIILQTKHSLYMYMILNFAEQNYNRLFHAFFLHLKIIIKLFQITKMA